MKGRKTYGGNGGLSSLITMLLGLALIVGALIMLVPVLLDYKKSDDTYKKLNQNFIAIAESGSMDESEGAEKTEENPNWWFEDVSVDLDELKEINPDVIGWIRFDHIEVISYPILYSGDNETYLRTDIYGNESNSGCIFLEGGNNPDFNDSHTIIYGHNMKNNGMFGRLKDYNKEGFYEDNQYFTIYANGIAYRYRIFAYHDVPETDAVYTIGFGPDSEFLNFINDIRRRSYLACDEKVSQSDKVVTLSTCSTEGNRFVIHAVRVDAGNYKQSNAE